MSTTRATSTRTIVRSRWSRSASAPACRANSSQGRRPASATPATAAGERVSCSARSGSETWKMPSARFESADAVKSLRKVEPRGATATKVRMDTVIGKSQSLVGSVCPVPPKHSYRPATVEEHKALSHPLRLRILRLCLDEPKTNRELADRLDANPATVLHHVRTLV